MFLGIYIFGFSLTILALVAWFYFQSKQGWTAVLKNFVLLGLVLYGLGVLLVPGTVDIKLGSVSQDLLVIAVAGLIFFFLVRKSAAFIIGLMILIIGVGWYYKHKLQYGFADRTIPLAEKELLVELSEGTDPDVLKNLLLDADLSGFSFERAFSPESPEQTELDDYYLVDIPEKQHYLLPGIKKKLYNSGVVDWVEDNEVILVDPVETAKTPNINKKFGVNDPGLEHLWGFEAMVVDQLYSYLRTKKVKPTKKALIAILDTGVDAEHEDIKANYKSIEKKYDNDPRGHGTHCAGIAASVTNNGKGVASFSPGSGFVQVSSIKVLSSMGSGTQKMIIDGILKAADKGADVISMSLGGRSSQSKQRAYNKAIAYANKKGAIVVAAAGNSSKDAKDYAPVNSKGIIGVSAIDNEINRAFFSNSVQNIKMGVAAPGVNIYSTVPGSKYESYNGTSMATPYVAGLIGLMKSLKPDLTTQEAYKILNETGKNTQKTKETGKLIQPHDAVRALLSR